MPGQYWMAPAPPFHITDGTAVTASATLTELTPVPQVVVPAGALQEFAGKRLEIQAWGHYTTTATQGTITIGLYSGSVGQTISTASNPGLICATSAIAWTASQTSRMWHIEGSVQIRSLGTAGTGIGFLDTSNLASGAADVPGSVAGTTAGGTVTFDTTLARWFALGATISVASQSITCRYLGVRMVN